MKIILAPYNPEWPSEFEAVQELISNALNEEKIVIEHIGSTSIPKMSAKPIIDIMVAIEGLVRSSDIILPLNEIGYEYFPIDTVPDRLFFAKESQPEVRTHHLNLVQKDSAFWKNQLIFRDYLANNNQLASEYIQLKRDFIEYYARTNHLDREWKTEFVTKVLKMAKEESKR